MKYYTPRTFSVTSSSSFFLFLFLPRFLNTPPSTRVSASSLPSIPLSLSSFSFRWRDQWSILVSRSFASAVSPPSFPPTPHPFRSCISAHMGRLDQSHRSYSHCCLFEKETNHLQLVWHCIVPQSHSLSPYFWACVFSLYCFSPLGFDNLIIKRTKGRTNLPFRPFETVRGGWWKTQVQLNIRDRSSWSQSHKITQ